MGHILGRLFCYLISKTVYENTDQKCWAVQWVYQRFFFRTLLPNSSVIIQYSSCAGSQKRKRNIMNRETHVLLLFFLTMTGSAILRISQMDIKTFFLWVFRYIFSRFNRQSLFFFSEVSSVKPIPALFITAYTQKYILNIYIKMFSTLIMCITNTYKNHFIWSWKFLFLRNKVVCHALCHVF